MMLRDEDAVRDGYTPSDGSPFVNGAKQILGFDRPEKDVGQGTGQIKTFNQLGFKGINDKPDGWYLPKDTSKVAIVLETKAESEDLSKVKWENELFKNIDIIATKYNKIIGILYNGKDVRIYKDKIEVKSVAPDLQDKQYYIDLYLNTKIDDKYYYTPGKYKGDIYEQLVKAMDDENAVYQWRRRYVRKNKSGVVPTLTANQGMGGHNVCLIKTKNGIRKMTPRECFNAQGFPKNFKIQDCISRLATVSA